MDLGGGEKVVLLLIALQDFALPRFDSDLVVDAPVHVSDSQMVWVDVRFAPYDDRALLVELIFLG